MAMILEKVKEEVKPGITTGELDKLTDALINQSGGRPSFKMVKGYHWATCLCVNEVVVHGIPNEYKLKEGDLLGIDIGLFYKGFHTDMAWTLRVQTPNSKLKTQNDEVDNFLDVGEKALNEAISVAKVGDRVGHISEAIQATIEAAGFSPVQALIGHGIGRELHEDPPVPCFVNKQSFSTNKEIEKTPLLKTGMTLAIEVIYNQGKSDVVYANDDGWTIQTVDGKLSGLFESTVVILAEGPEILTQTN